MLGALLTTIAAVLLLPSLVLLLECVAAVLARRPPEGATAGEQPRFAVLVPAHDEAAVIEHTVATIRRQLASTDRLVVVADNCADATAALARAAGATVIERNDRARRGKGYALEYGIEYLSLDPPEVVVVVDADCMVHQGAVQRLSREAAASGRPTQARNMVTLPPGAGPHDFLSAFAFLVKNVVRPSGLAQLGLPCALMGTGMAFPWSVISKASLATGAIAEDLQLGADLAMAGHPPAFCYEALVTSPLPGHRKASEAQRRRWEHGHLATLVSHGPRLLRASVLGPHPALLALALDLMVPPLSLLILTWAAALAVAILAALLGASRLPATLLGLAGSSIFLAIGMAWAAFGRRDFPLRTLLVAPVYVLAKVPLYIGFLGRRQREWVRTEREPSARKEPDTGRRPPPGEADR